MVCWKCPDGSEITAQYDNALHYRTTASAQWQIGAAQRAHLLDSKLTLLSHAFEQRPDDGCSSISKCDTILFVFPLPLLSPLAVLAAVECQFAARALVVLESTGDLSYFGPVPSTIGTRRRTTSSIPSSRRREKPKGKKAVGKVFVFSSKFSPKKKNYQR